MWQQAKRKNRPVVKSDTVKGEEMSSIKPTIRLQWVTSCGVDQ